MKMGAFLIVFFSLFLMKPIVHADEVRYIAYDEQFIAAVVSSIESAKKSIDIAYFIYEPCHPSTKFVRQLLVKKASQGVRVRFLLDAFMYKKKMRQAMARDFADSGIEFKFYNPKPLVNPAVNFRMHVKLLLVDKKSYISGGRNIADEYFGLSPVYNFIDADVWVTGRSATQVSASFEELWNDRWSRSVKLKKGPSLAELCQQSEAPQDEKWTKRVHKFMGQTASKVTPRMTKHSCQARFVSDDPQFYKYPSQANSEDKNTPILGGKRLQAKRATVEFLDFIGQTQESLELENWSYMPLDFINQELRNLRQQNIPILVMTNMDADNNGVIKNAEDFLNHRFAKRDTEDSQIVIQLASRGHLSDRHALTPKKSYFRLHQKTGLRDHRDIMVGSFNIDPRSYHTNLESIVIFEGCRSFAKEYAQHASDLVRTYNKDYETGYHKTPPPPKLGTILFSFFGFDFL